MGPACSVGAKPDREPQFPNPLIPQGTLHEEGTSHDRISRQTVAGDMGQGQSQVTGFTKSVQGIGQATPGPKGRLCPQGQGVGQEQPAVEMLCRGEEARLLGGSEQRRGWLHKGRGARP